MNKEEMDKHFSKKKIFEDLKHDFKKAKEAKSSIDKQINEWNDAYYGKIPSMKNRSKYVAMEIAKQVELTKPNITEPFTNTSHPIRVFSSKNEARSRIIQKYLNTQFTSEFNRVEFMEKFVDLLFREGTVWVKSGWKLKEENVREVIPNATMDEIINRGGMPDSIAEAGDDKFRVEYNTTKLIQNDPDAIICRNEHIFPDPGARTTSELRFMCYKRLMTISEMKASGRYTDDMINRIESSIESKRDDTGLGSQRDSDALDRGNKLDYDTKDKARNKISIIEYWGYYDLNNDGIAEPIFASWAEGQDVNLVCEENDLPNENIPFYRTVYSDVSFSLWGNALAFFIEDGQNAKTGIYRGIFDNMALANNGQKFIKHGSLDYVNFKRLRNGEKHIFVNKEGMIEDGSFNNLPNSIFNVLQSVSKENEDLSGISSGGLALNSSQTNKDNESGQLTLAQQRMASSVTNVAETLGNIFQDWIKMAEVFLEDEQIRALFTESEQQDIASFEDSEHMRLTFKVATNAQIQVKLHHLNMLMQQAKALGETIPPELIRELVAEMFELFDMYDKAEALRTYKPEPNPMQEAMAKEEIRKVQLENNKLEAEINEINSRIQVNGSTAQKNMMDGVSGAQYKKAQETEKYKKAEAHEADTAFKPAVIMAQIESLLKERNK